MTAVCADQKTYPKIQHQHQPTRAAWVTLAALGVTLTALGVTLAALGVTLTALGAALAALGAALAALGVTLQSPAARETTLVCTLHWV